MIDHKLRRLGLGGSEIGAIFGVDPYRDAFAVWAAKKSDQPPDPPNERMIAGHILEPAVLKLYAIKTGREVEYCDVTSQVPERPWQVYTPDALVRGERRGVDAKVVSWDQRRKWGDTVEEIPDHIQLQACWYMSAMDYEAWDIAAFMGDGFPHIYTVIRDIELERVVLARAEEFYCRYLVGDEVPAIGASPAAAIWLQQAFPHHKRPDLRPATEPEVAMLEQYAQLRVEQKEMAEERAELENLIKLAIREREGLVWFGGKFTWRKTKDRTITNWEAIARGLLTQVDPDTREALLSMHTYVKAGYRRVLLDSDLLREKNDDD